MQPKRSRWLWCGFMGWSACVFAFILPGIVLWRSGELREVEEIVGEMTKPGQVVRYNPAYLDRTRGFKKAYVKLQQPGILVAGSSRTLQFRGRFFRKPTDFFNAGLAVRRLEEFRPFFDEVIGSTKPRLIIMAFDQNFFLPQWESEFMLRDVMDRDVFENVTAARPQIYRDWFRGKFNLGQLLHPHELGVKNIGLHAIIRHTGYRNDGSYREDKGVFDPTSQDYQFRYTLGLVQRGENRLGHSAIVSESAMLEAARILDQVQVMGSHAVVFLPPFAPTLYDTMKDLAPRYDYMKQLGPRLHALCAQRGFSFFDYSDMRTVESSDREALDGYHGSEKTHLRMVQQMAKSDPVLALEVDLAQLQQALANAKTDLLVFGD